MSDDLRALSDAATPGPWDAVAGALGDPGNGPDHMRIVKVPHSNASDAIARLEYDQQGGADAAYIAALVNAHRAGQQVVMAADAEALMDERDAALAKMEATKDALRVAIKEGSRFRGERDAARAECARLRAQVAAVEALCDEEHHTRGLDCLETQGACDTDCPTCNTTPTD